MVRDAQVEDKKFVLPAHITGPADVNRVLLELEELEDFMHQAGLRKGGEPVALPKTSLMLERLADYNNANLLQTEDRERLVVFMRSIKMHAPVMHISFASEPSAAFTAKIVEWLRKNISGYVLLHIGMQPFIAGGCVVRTTNKVFDFTLRKHLQKNRVLLVQALEGLDGYRTLEAREKAAAKGESS